MKKAWYVLDEAAVKCSSRHVGGICSVCTRIAEAMELLREYTPTPEECKDLHKLRMGKE